MTVEETLIKAKNQLIVVLTVGALALIGSQAAFMLTIKDTLRLHEIQINKTEAKAERALEMGITNNRNSKP